MTRRVGVGDTIGQYRLVEQLGRGGMAVVFRAYQPSLDRDVAVKILSATHGGPDFVERFRREARAISRLRHQNILSVFDFGEDAGLVYMVGEYVPGGDLARRLGSPQPLDWVGVRLTALASALDYAHAHAVIHRDVKPSNVLLTANDMPILSDFGVAKLLSDGVADLTASGTVVGTPEYMAPEQALGRDVGPPSDVYSLGVMLYQMLVGRPPFSGSTPVAVALAHVHTPPPPPRTINPDLPTSVEAVLQRVLVKDPLERYQRAGDLAIDYAAAIGVDIRELSNLAAVTPPSIPRVESGRPLPLAIPSTSPDSLSSVPTIHEQRTARAPLAPDRPRTPPPPSAEPTARRPDLVEAPRRSGFLGLLAGAVVALAIVGALVFTLQDQFVGTPNAPSTPTADRPTPTLAAAAQATRPTSTPTAGPTSSPTGVPTQPPTPTGAPTATPTLRIAPSGGLTLRIQSPVNGAQVPEKFVVRGVREGPLSPNQHLWLMARPRQGPDNWWANEPEIVPNAAGEWQTQVYLGGEPGLFHRLAIGVADEAAHQAILRHLAQQTGQPFERGLPSGFTTLAEVSVEKRAD